MTEVCKLYMYMYVSGKIVLLACVAGIKQGREEGSQRKGIEEGGMGEWGNGIPSHVPRVLPPFLFPIYACNAG